MKQESPSGKEYSPAEGCPRSGYPSGKEARLQPRMGQKRMRGGRISQFIYDGAIEDLAPKAGCDGDDCAGTNL